MKIVNLIGLGIGGTTALAGTGVAINYFYGGESIESFLKKSNSDKVFFDENTDGFDAILTAYESSKKDKPKDKENKDIARTELVNWCKKAIKGKYYGNDESNFKGVNSWCFINTNSFEQQLKNKENKKISEQAATHTDWTSAWSSYSQGRTDTNLKIIYAEKQTDLDASDATKGAEALKAWCEAKKVAKLYEDDAEKEYGKFDHWCPKVNS